MINHYLEKKKFGATRLSPVPLDAQRTGRITDLPTFNMSARRG